MPCYAISPRHAASPALTLSARPVSSLFPRFPHPAPFYNHHHNDFAQLFRLFDDVSSSLGPNSSRQSFAPRFDVREEAEAYHLQGELPGIDQKDVQIEFVDSNTLTIQGRTVRESHRGKPATEPQQQTEQVAEANTEATDQQEQPERPASTGSNYRSPTVENEDEFVDVSKDDNTANVNAAAAPEKSKEAEAAATTTPEAVAIKTETNENKPRYWVSERSVGSFHRSFTFPGRIDQNAVRASLKNGILNVTVPKKQVEGPRRIAVE